MPEPMLLVGLGNPGEKYARNRHNVGFLAVDAIATRRGFSAPRLKFRGELRDGALGEGAARRRVFTLKPLTYMNDSGDSVGAAMRFLKIAPHDVVVFHDELDLAAGKIKAKTGGGLAGHNGLKSIEAHIGPDFRRIRIGIGHPGEKARVHGHVLGDFAKADAEWLDPLLDAIADCAPAILESDARFASDLALKLAPERPAKAPPPAGAAT